MSENKALGTKRIITIKDLKEEHLDYAAQAFMSHVWDCPNCGIYGFCFNEVNYCPQCAHRVLLKEMSNYPTHFDHDLCWCEPSYYLDTDLLEHKAVTKKKMN